MAEVDGSRDRRSEQFATYRLVGNTMAVLVLLVAAGEIWRNWLEPRPVDFMSFWGAAQLAIRGDSASAYDLAALHQVQSAVTDFGESGARMPFPYMPAFLLLVMPLGFLPYPLAMAVWLAATAAAYLIMIRRLFPGSGLLALAFPPALVNLAIGQNGFLTASLFAGSVAMLPRRPLVAGIIAGCLIFKPQLGLLFPLAFVASRQWRAVTGAALSSTMIAVSGVLLFGAQTTVAWARQLPLYGSIMRDGSVGWDQLTSVYAAARQGGIGADLAFTLHLIVAAAATLAVWRVWRRSSDPLASAAVLACATALASPYLFLYDQLILVIPLLWLAQRKCHPAIVSVLWLLPIAIIGQHLLEPGAINLGPVLPMALLVLVMRQLKLSGVPSRAADLRSAQPAAEPLRQQS